MLCSFIEALILLRLDEPDEELNKICCSREDPICDKVFCTSHVLQGMVFVIGYGSLDSFTCQGRQGNIVKIIKKKQVNGPSLFFS